MGSTESKTVTNELPTEIKVIGSTEHGKSDVLKELSVPLPELRDHDILVKVEATSYNPIDTKKNEGMFHDGNFPLTLGFDGSGVVAAVGKNAQKFKVGEEVYFSGDITRQGAHGDYVAVDERITSKKPTTLSHAESAAMPLVTLTVFEAFFEAMGISEDASVNAGKNILIIAGAGGVGSVGIQVAKQFGLTVVATASRAESIEYCKSLGADFVVNHREEYGPQLEAIKQTSFNYIFNLAPPDTNFDKIAPLTGPRCQIVHVLPFSTPPTIPIEFFVKRVGLHYEFMFSRSMNGYELESQGSILEKMASLLDSKKVKSAANKELKWSLESFKTAFDLSSSGTTIGKIVISK